MSIVIKNLTNYILPIFLILFFFTFIAYIPIPFSIDIGLDPSWQYAISRAAVDKLVFGKDIIFTYGLFGYLVRGAVTDTNFLSIFIFRFLVHLILFIITIVKSLELQTTIQKILLYTSISLTYPSGALTDYQILFAFIIILSFKKIWQSQFIQWLSLGLGAFTGFCLLTKFYVRNCYYWLPDFIFIW